MKVFLTSEAIDINLGHVFVGDFFFLLVVVLLFFLDVHDRELGLFMHTSLANRIPLKNF